MARSQAEEAPKPLDGAIPSACAGRPPGSEDLDWLGGSREASARAAGELLTVSLPRPPASPARVPPAGPATRAGNASRDAIVVGRFLGTVVVTLHGNVDLINATALAHVLHDLIDGQGNLAVVVDLRDVSWVDGAGVGVLASAASRIETRGGELRLGGPGGTVAEALALSGLGRLINIPFEQAHRRWPRVRSEAEASHRAGD